MRMRVCRMQMIRVAPVIVAMVSLAGCGGNSTPRTPTAPTAPSPVVSPAGGWSGSMSDPIKGSGTARLSLTAQAPNALTGTWSVMFENGDAFSGPAVAVVTATGYGITLNADPPPTCTTSSGGSALLGYTLINLVVTPTQLTAVSGRLSCSGISFGSVNLSKQ
jgi:hypothetical protein